MQAMIIAGGLIVVGLRGWFAFVALVKFLFAEIETGAWYATPWRHIKGRWPLFVILLRRLVLFGMDLVLTIGCMAMARLFLRSTASDITGATLGLMASIGLTLAVPYARYIWRTNHS